MKSLYRSLAFFFLLILTGCLDLTEEITINEDESGIYSSVSDMSGIISMVKMMGGEDAGEMENLKQDTVISLSTIADSIPDLSDEQKKILGKGNMKIKADMEEEILNFAFEIPYETAGEFHQIKFLMNVVFQEMLSNLKNMNPGNQEGADDFNPSATGNTGDLSLYFDLEYGQGRISKNLNQDKYKEKDNDEGLKSLNEMGQMGSPMKVKTIINLPRPATKAEGMNLILSEDKRTVTVENTIDEFFDEPVKFEFLVEF